MGVDIYADSNSGPLEFKLRGYERTISGDEALQQSTRSPRQMALYRSQSAFIPETAKLFTGSIITKIENKPVEKVVNGTSLDTGITGSMIKREVHYIPSFGHLRYDLLKNIVDNTEYKKLVIDILRQFDDSIADICYTKADDGSYVESIITKNGVNMPFSVYGDGIKNIIYS